VNEIAHEGSGLLSLEPLQAIEANPGNLREMLKRVIRENLKRALADAQFLEAIAFRSYTHPNGFSKLILTPSVYPEGELRLHVWDNESWAGVDSKIHNHAWDFASMVLCGALENVVYDIAEGDSFWLQRVDVLEGINNWSASRYNINEAGQIGAAVSLRNNMPQGTLYAQRADVFHQVIPREAFCVSAVLQGPFQSDGSFILTRAPVRQGPVGLRSLSIERVADLCHRIGETSKEVSDT
jgi:hypothetical protein